MNNGIFLPEDVTLKSTSGTGAVTAVSVDASNDHRFLIADNTGTSTGDMLVSVDGGTTYPIFVRAGGSFNFPLAFAPKKDVVIKRNGATDVANAWVALARYLPLGN